MKRKWEEPKIKINEFAANEYVAEKNQIKYQVGIKLDFKMMDLIFLLVMMIQFQATEMVGMEIIKV